MTKIQKQQRVALLFFLVPGMAYLVLLRIVPALYTLYLSFTEWDLVEQAHPVFIGLDNYKDILTDMRFLDAVKRTAVFTLSATGSELLLGLAIAIFVHREFKGKSFVRAALLTPMIITPAVVGLIWYILFHNIIGPLNYAVESLGLGAVGWLTNPDTALASVVLVDIWHWTPFMFLLLLSALQVVPDELYEAANVDGASSWQSFVRITLPMIRDTMIVAVILRSMEAFRIFSEPFVMTGGGPGTATETLSLHIYKAAFQFFEMGYAGSMVVVSITILTCVYAIYMRYVRFD